MKGSSNPFRKNRPSASSDYIGQFTRSKKTSRRQNSAPATLKKFKPGTTSLKFGPAATTPAASGFLFMLAVFAIVFFSMILIYKFA